MKAGTAAAVARVLVAGYTGGRAAECVTGAGSCTQVVLAAMVALRGWNATAAAAAAVAAAPVRTVMCDTASQGGHDVQLEPDRQSCQPYIERPEPGSRTTRGPACPWTVATPNAPAGPAPPAARCADIQACRCRSISFPHPVPLHTFCFLSNAYAAVAEPFFQDGHVRLLALPRQAF